MNPLFIYLLKASATIFTLWAFYAVCLRRMTFHNLNRYFFLTGILISLIWPALPLTEWFSNAVPVNQVIVYIPVSALMMQFKPSTPSFDFEMAFKIVYFGGVLFMLIRLSVQILSLRAIFRKSEIRMINGVVVRVVNEKINPFSFFGYIFINPENHTPTELAAIILHEKVHKTRTHSVDILLSELIKIMLWFNPFSWLFCRAVKENIEFEVDRELLQRGVDCKEYQYSLLKLSAIKNQIVITNHFNLSNLKTRIIMMNKNQSSRYGLAAYALVIPLILFCMLFSYAFAQNKPIVDTVKQFTFKVMQKKPMETPDGALIILDGKVIDKATMDAINPEDIYAVNVLKGKDATDIYGKKGKNGVVLVTSKNKNLDEVRVIGYKIINDSASGTSKNKTLNEVTVIGYARKDTLGGKNKPLIIINGKEISEGEMKELDAKDIQSINVLKNGSATTLYGDKGKNGVIIITRKGTSTGTSTGSYSTYSVSSSNSGDAKPTTFVISSTGEGKDALNEFKRGERIITTTQDGITTIEKTKDGKTTIEKRIIVNSSGDTKPIVLNLNSDTNTNNGVSISSSKVQLMPDDVYVLIDGKEGSLKDLNPDTIEKIEVLKGESATKVYGVKGAKGVMLITTKKK